MYCYGNQHKPNVWKPIVIEKLHCVENPKNEEDEPMYKRKLTCFDCLKRMKQTREENKEHITPKLKEDNTHKCDCGGSYFLGLNGVYLNSIR